MECLMGTAPLSKAVGEIVKLLLIDRPEQHHHRPLDYLVLKSRFADRTLASFILLKPCPLNGWCLIPPASQALVKVREVLLEVLAILPGRHPVHPCRPIFGRQVISLPQKLHVHQVRQCREYHLRIVDCLLRNPLESR
jgi:hypothetical protein